MQHYFSPAPPPKPADLRQIDATLAGRPVRLASAPGVFSAHRLDLGTSVLLRTEARLKAAAARDLDRFPPPDAANPPGAASGGGRNLLDLGCGWGPLALALALYEPDATVWAIDTNPRALALTRLNADRLGLAKIRAELPEAVPAGIEFDLIWSNPPVRVGKQALQALLATWLARLTQDGWADLVVGKNLGADSLARWLTEQAGFPARKLASAKGYRVLRAGRTAVGPAGC
ncbi:MAG: methyltransferase [Bifidobacteriaceae bacterium]|nr:methyltransferase [Bifidobacteriaceae bacterium]